MRYKVFDVFARAPLEGNPTGIVYYEGPEDTSLMQRLATEFPVPDTLFFTRKTNVASLFACRTFSPYEELAICAQGLIGAMYALMEDGQVGSGHYVVETALGSRGLQLEHNETTSIFCSLGCPTLSEPHEDERIHIARLGFNDCIAPPPMAYVDLGRKRLVVEVPASRTSRRRSGCCHGRLPCIGDHGDCCICSRRHLSWPDQISTFHYIPEWMRRCGDRWGCRSHSCFLAEVPA